MKKIILFVIFILIGFLNLVYAESLKAGIAKIDITPKIGTPLAGYSGRQGVSKGVHDKLYARCLILSANEKIAIVSADMMYIRKNLYDIIRQRIEKETGIKKDNLIICASHSHSASGALFKEMEFIAGKFNKKVFDELCDKFIKVIVEANKNLVDAKIGFGFGKAEGCNHNRRQKGGPYDPEVGVIRVDDKAGNLLAVLYNFAAHPTVLGGGNLLFSADWPGTTSSALEGVYGNKSIAMFANGAEGNMGPGDFGGNSDFERVERLGYVVAAEVLKILQMINTSADVKIELIFQPLLINPKFGIKTYILGLLINKTLLITVPGEAFIEYQIDWKKKAKELGFENLFVLGIANDGVGYIMPTEIYHQHPYESLLSLFGPNLGPFIYEQEVKLMEKLK